MGLVFFVVVECGGFGMEKVNGDCSGYEELKR